MIKLLIKRAIFFATIIIVCLLITAVLLRLGDREIEDLKTGPLLSTTISPPTTSPKPFQFQEMTIPFLRGRKYDSDFTDLKILSENTAYISYLGNYTSDGIKINFLLTVPKGNAPAGGWPGVIFVHGYIPPKNYKTTENYSAYIDSTAKKGIIILKIDLRGHGDSEGEPGGAYYSSDYVVDTLNALSAFKKYPLVDSENISLWGHSMAGNILLRSFVANENIRKIIIWAGAVYSYEDMQKYKINDASYRPPTSESAAQRKRQQLFNTYGQFNPNHPFWKQVAPTNYLVGKKGGLQLHHAVNDSVVSIEYSRDLIKILEGTAISSELFEYEGGGHNLFGSSFSEAMNRTVEFIKEK